MSTDFEDKREIQCWSKSLLVVLVLSVKPISVIRPAFFDNFVTNAFMFWCGPRELDTGFGSVEKHTIDGKPDALSHLDIELIFVAFPTSSIQLALTQVANNTISSQCKRVWIVGSKRLPKARFVED